jgi:hypothetical protein
VGRSTSAGTRIDIDTVRCGGAAYLVRTTGRCSLPPRAHEPVVAWMIQSLQPTRAYQPATCAHEASNHGDRGGQVERRTGSTRSARHQGDEDHGQADDTSAGYTTTPTLTNAPARTTSVAGEVASCGVA